MQRGGFWRGRRRTQDCSRDGILSLPLFSGDRFPGEHVYLSFTGCGVLMPKLNGVGLGPQVELSMVPQGTPKFGLIRGPLCVVEAGERLPHHRSGQACRYRSAHVVRLFCDGWVLGSVAQPARNARWMAPNHRRGRVAGRAVLTPPPLLNSSAFMHHNIDC